MLTFKIKSNYKLRKIIFKEIIRMIMEDDILQELEFVGKCSGALTSVRAGFN